MSHFFLVRHGETIWHAENRYAGSTDIDLTLQGEQQPLVLRGWALNAQLMHLYASAEGVEQVSIDELLQRSNAISLHAREIPESRGMIGAKQIAQMPRGSVLVNCARVACLITTPFTTLSSTVISMPRQPTSSSKSHFPPTTHCCNSPTSS
jgi:hypothetical protein